MTDLLHAIDPATIATAIEANINAYLLSFARLPGATLHEGDEAVWVDTGVADATVNAVVSARFRPDAVDAGVAAILAHFARRGRPFTWHVGPSTQPADLGRALLAHGLTHSEDEPGMALELDRLRDAAAPPTGLTIEPVRDPRGLEDWVDAWLFPLPPDARRRPLDTLLRRGLGDDLPWRHFVGWLDGRPVATAELFVGAGLAAVHYAVTVPEARRRGIGAALTSHALREARALGYRVAALTASPDGIGIYRRLGFREYCWFRRYEWDPNQGPTGG